MTVIRRLRLVLPARFAGTAPEAARALAERLVDGLPPEALGPAGAGGPLELSDRGQSAAMLGTEAAMAARPRGGGK
ncbi:MAG: hypothetical protein OEM24_12950 [Paracoccaceae bacterium]|nr:hypothetical protein [Paracoccaceae bacterium]